MLHLWCVTSGVRKSNWVRLHENGELRAVFEVVGNLYPLGSESRSASPSSTIAASDSCGSLFPVSLVQRGVPIQPLLSALGKSAPEIKELGTPQGGARLYELQANRVLDVVVADYVTRLVGKIRRDGVYADVGPSSQAQILELLILIDGPPTDRLLVYLANLYAWRSKHVTVAFFSSDMQHLLSNVQLQRSGQVSTDLFEVSQRAGQVGSPFIGPYSAWPSGLAQTFFVLPEYLDPPMRECAPARVDILSQALTELELAGCRDRVLRVLNRRDLVSVVHGDGSSPALIRILPLKETEEAMQARLRDLEFKYLSAGRGVA